jgi:hypothetical protein
LFGGCLAVVASYGSETLQLVEGTITISDPVIRQEFNKKIVSEEIQRQLLIKKQYEYSQMQARIFRALAIDPRNVGLQ